MDSLNPIPHPKSPDVVSDAGDRRLPRTGPRPPDPEQLPCPRCDSTNTKFCYYNNYNLSQPRHFCKSCRRYWTRGGALRKVPIGGGIRKPPSSSTKRRPRITTPTNTKSGGDNNATAQSKYADPVVSIPDPGLGSGPGNPNEVKSGILGCWWSGTGQIDPDVELLPLNGYGLELGPGCEDGVFDWLMEPVSGGGADAAAVVSGESPRCSTWRMGGGEGGGVADAGDYFSWPDLAISTPPKALK